jgi:oligoribonuclease NrnB/cAMP/cGMP phosphodiesterase (DHH superfamily)
VWKAYGDRVEFLAARYQEPAPHVEGRGVLIVDFSYPRAMLEEMAAQASWLLVLDHHKTAEADLAGFEAPNAKVVFDLNRSGAGITWDHLFGLSTRPLLIDYVEDRDLWRKKLPGVDRFTAALRSYPKDFKVWDGLKVGTLLAEGEAIERYYRTLVEQAKKHAYRREIAGHEVPVVNAGLFMASEVANELAEGEAFAAVYAEDKDSVTFSLRSRPGGLDVSEIAKRFGGGGHKHAAGFKVGRVYAPLGRET